jgi:tetratricopeptide (TPR) repeat protein
MGSYRKDKFGSDEHFPQRFFHFPVWVTNVRAKKVTARVGTPSETSRKTIRVEWGDCDPAGIVYYPRYCAYFDNCTSALFGYEKALHLRPGTASFYSNMGAAYFGKKEFEQASDDYSKALELDPDILERNSHTGISAQLPSPDDRARYDFIVAKLCAVRGESDRALQHLRRSTSVLNGRGYEVQPIYSVYRDVHGRGKAGYSSDEIDLLVVHIRPVDVWYVIPVEAFVPAKCLRFYPDILCKAARWEGFREAWAVMEL